MSAPFVPQGESPDRSQVFRMAVGGEASTVRVGPRTLSLGRGEDVLNWDRAGRPTAGSLGGTTWHRTLDGRMVEITTERGGRHARWMSGDEVRSWSATLRGWAAAVLEAAAEPSVVEAFGPPAAFDEAAWDADARRFHEVYQPVAILPPDQYLALVVQATIGCSWNRCTFCDFYRDRRYAVRPADEFRAHVRAVRDFFGAGVAARRSLFLGDANALATPRGRVVEWLRILREEFPVRVEGGLSRAPGAHDPPSGFNGIHGFLDVATGVRHGADDWAELAAEGLTTVFVGIESGHDPLLPLLGKPGSAHAARDLVEAAKRGGLAVGLVLLAGVGGQEHAAAHEAASAALVDALPLGREDLVYISPYVDQPGSRYRAAEAAAGLTPLDASEAWAQAARIKARLASLRRPDGPRAALYDVRLFAY